MFCWDVGFEYRKIRIQKKKKQIRTIERERKVDGGERKKRKVRFVLRGADLQYVDNNLSSLSNPIYQFRSLSKLSE